MTPEARARKVADSLWAADAASQGLGLRIDAVGPGRAVLSMEIEDRHLNGHGICHGGFIFTLADSAFAFACNADNHVTVAQENQITFLSPGQRGERLEAEALEQARSGRSGVFDVTVRGGDGRVVALMRGLSRRTGGQHFDEGSND